MHELSVSSGRMKFISRDNIDLQKWDDLVRKTPGSSVFSLSAYLDEIAENWMVYVDENYTKGIAVPFASRLGIKTCYTPIFITTLEWLGDTNGELSTFLTEVKSFFSLGNFCIRQQLDKHDCTRYVEQIIHPDSAIEIGSQAKRMLNKSQKVGHRIEYSNDPQPVLASIRSELLPKISSLTEASIERLERALRRLDAQQHVRILSVFDKQEFVGGLFLIDFNNIVLYLKGAFTDEAKKNGAMYNAMNFAIHQAHKEGKTFDFGGSRVEGVRHFNLQLGGKDRTYFVYQWDTSPSWYRAMKIVRNLFQKKG
jgi:hypothetical protein